MGSAIAVLTSSENGWFRSYEVMPTALMALMQALTADSLQNTLAASASSLRALYSPGPFSKA